ncbi:unnamed protein product, partial [Effrenium voratum]
PWAPNKMHLKGAFVQPPQLQAKPAVCRPRRARPSFRWQSSWKASPLVLLAMRTPATSKLPPRLRAREVREDRARQREHANLPKEPVLVPMDVPGEANESNEAFLMLKPHASTAKAREAVRKILEDNGIAVVKDGSISAEDVRQRRLIDKHYGRVAQLALEVFPQALVVPKKGQAAFKECFGLPWKQAMEKDLVVNADQAMKRLGWTSDELGTRWDELKSGVGKVKFGGGFYCGCLSGLYIINGFYMAMRDNYFRTGRSVEWFCLEWRASKMSWKKFREEVIGETDPAVAHPHSLRRHFFENWERLDLPSEPHTGENCIHGAASPLEATMERRNWLHDVGYSDAFWQLLHEAGATPEHLEKWRLNPVVTVGERTCALFDHVENLDCFSCVEALQPLLRS